MRKSIPKLECWTTYPQVINQFQYFKIQFLNLKSKHDPSLKRYENIRCSNEPHTVSALADSLPEIQKCNVVEEMVRTRFTKPYY